MPELFGSYVIHEELGVGGMASVHLAESRGVDGVRQVALKRLFRHVADVPELLASFIDEARLARYLRHPNIARVYEFGRRGGVYFIALEFVPGPTVHQLMRHCRQHVGRIPISLVLEIVWQLCDALDHAHNLRDEAGEPLGIVHRDVSPHNLIVSSSGFVKLIDFGLAKAKHSSVQSQAGIIKGKLNYVAPEYIHGKLDARCDLWAVGVLLHEMLSGRRLFGADDDFATLEQVRSMPIAPPSKSNAAVSRELDEIVLTALQRDPARRWQSASKMRTALSTFSNLSPRLTKPQLSAWVEWAFSQRLEVREDSGVSALHDIIESGQIEEVSHREEEAPLVKRLPASSAAMMERRRESVASMHLVGAAMLHRRRRGPWLWIMLLLLAAAGGFGAAWRLGFVSIDW